MTGEVVVTPEQIDSLFRSSGIPTTESQFDGGSPSVEMNINVAGNLDKSVLPEMDKIANKVALEITKAMNMRGYNRRSDAFST